LQSYKTNVLLVDDEELVRELLARILSDAGFAVEQADNGASALQAARRLDGSLSLVITDVNMPIMDGLEFARALRKTDREIPFLFITGLDPAIINESGFQAGLLPKPFTPEEFLDAVTRLIKPVGSDRFAG
jgi:CheY-like chemotaxis protein